MIFPAETQNKETVQKAIENRKAWIADLEEGLPYADHGTYGQDLDRIREYQEEIIILKRSLENAP